MYHSCISLPRLCPWISTACGSGRACCSARSHSSSWMNCSTLNWSCLTRVQGYHFSFLGTYWRSGLSACICGKLWWTDLAFQAKRIWLCLWTWHRAWILPLPWSVRTWGPVSATTASVAAAFAFFVACLSRTFHENWDRS